MKLSDRSTPRFAALPLPARWFVSALAALFLCVGTTLAAGPKPIVVDTDFETDVDDVSALALLHALADRGEVTILGMAVAGTHADAAPAIATLNAYFGRPEIPVGIRPPNQGVARKSSYTGTIIKEYAYVKPRFDFTLSIALYRKLLSAAEDRSVTIISLGYLTNLADLLASPPDAISPLRGHELVAKKVRQYVCMGGAYPRQSRGGKWGNFLPDPAAVIRVARDWPTPLVFTGGGDFSRSVPVGAGILESYPADHLVRRSYEAFFAGTTWAKPPHHHAADLIAAYIGARGIGPHFEEHRGGYNHIFPDGTMEWRAEPDHPLRSYVAKFSSQVNPVEFGRELENLVASAKHVDPSTKPQGAR